MTAHFGRLQGPMSLLEFGDGDDRRSIVPEHDGPCSDLDVDRQQITLPLPWFLVLLGRPSAESSSEDTDVGYRRREWPSQAL